MCVLRNAADPADARAFIAPSFAEIIRHPDEPAVIAVDIPIGLPGVAGAGGRACDGAARAFLGKRSMAVFAVPARAALEHSDYRQACAAALAHSDPPRQISRQMFNILPKVREVDALMTPEMQSRVHECHPEAAFAAMNGGQPLAEPKKRKGRANQAGLDLRRALLIAEGFGERFLRDTRFPRARATEDDFLDACACAWTAARIFAGTAMRLPPDPPRDEKGLRMEILV
jgi:predicted RNase H-like nuclease